MFDFSHARVLHDKTRETVDGGFQAVTNISSKCSNFPEILNLWKIRNPNPDRVNLLSVLQRAADFHKHGSVTEASMA